jgi:tRNA threonylcarbamoyladenosine biosynthesis protein TsaB
MKILALELSTTRGSIAWLDENSNEPADSAACEWANDRKHSGLFFENVGKITQKFGAPGKIIVGLGPGSYAGVRIAISGAIGLGVASDAHLMGFPSICAIDSAADDYAVIGDARRQSFYFARIRQNEIIEGPRLLRESELRTELDKLKLEIPIFSSDKLTQFDCVEFRCPSALVLARLAQNEKRNFFSPPLQPIYLREPHITMPKTTDRSVGIVADKGFKG